MKNDSMTIGMSIAEIIEGCCEAGYSPLECAQFIIDVMDADGAEELEKLAHKLEADSDEATRQAFVDVEKTVVCEVNGVLLTLRDFAVACAACEKSAETYENKDGWRVGMLRSTADKLFAIADAACED